MTDQDLDSEADTSHEVVEQAAVDRKLTGMRAIAQSGEKFDFMATVGGVRGLIESTAPGLLFVVAFVAVKELKLPLILACAATVVIVAVRLFQRGDATQAFSGAIGVAIGVIWAWRTGEANNYFAYGLVLNLSWSIALLISVLVRHPAFGYFIALLRAEDLKAWRIEPHRSKAAYVVTWLWIATFCFRLLVQLPLYFQDEVGWLGTAKLIMGVPLTVVMAWVSWMIVRTSVREAEEAKWVDIGPEATGEIPAESDDAT